MTGSSGDFRSVLLRDPPFIIGEISGNHNGRIDTAMKIMNQAKSAGFDAVKLQTYTPDCITIDCDRPDFLIEEGLWSGNTLHELYMRACTPLEWHHQLFAYGESIGLCIFSSVFSELAVDILEEIDCPAYKIASFECVDLDLIRYAASTGKPLIISTGLSSQEEIDEAVDAAVGAGCDNLSLMYCISSYPAEYRDFNLSLIPQMSARYGLKVGLSDHSVGSCAAMTATALGASLIEKHITLDSEGGGVDDSFSLPAGQMRQFISDVRNVSECIGIPTTERAPSELINLKFRRSLYFVKDVPSGVAIKADMVKSIRPGYGLPPKFKPRILGKYLVKDVVRGQRVSWDCINEN